ncbi:MAG: 2-isopropylmalate synthase [Clostridiales bacterium]|nr:2-isopropylmalate synthase [Clostridiales bacterium]
MYKSEKWWISPYNFDPEVKNSWNLPSYVKFHDGTLRDGEQTPGLVFSEDDKVKIASMLSETGVDRIEAGMPAVSKADYNAIKRIVNLGLKAEIYSFTRASEQDIDLSAECGVDGVVIEIPTSEPKLKYQFPKWTEEDIIERSVQSIEYAKSKNLKVVYFGYDTTRANWSFLERLLTRVKIAGPDSVGVVDTVGCILPEAMKKLISDIKQLIDLPVEVHVHNDLGLATANTLAAVAGGAEVVHVCVNGLGERAGNATLDEIAVGLNVFYNLGKQINLSNLTELSSEICKITNFSPAVNKPITGKNAYLRESGIGIDLVMNKPLAMFSLDPSLIGNKAGVLLGKKSGLKSIETKINELGLKPLSEEKQRTLLELIKNESIKTKCTISDKRFIELLQEIK